MTTKTLFIIVMEKKSMWLYKNLKKKKKKKIKKKKKKKHLKGKFN